jgi:glycosyltransferase involved in cell wall biosynthesis
VDWHALAPPLGTPLLRWARRGEVRDLARRVRADLVIERYYNFGGEGVLSAGDLGLPAVLEVNAPVVDLPGSAKARLDRALLFEPLRRWRDRLCRAAALIVTPSAVTVPAWLDRDRILEVEWGADVDRFRPGAAGPGRALVRRDPDRILCVFAGAFRTWHGAIHLAEALARLHRTGDHRFGGLFVGEGPEREAVERAARGIPGVHFTGAVAHGDMPAVLAAADIGVAPFDVARHAPLALGFYWSPLKIFEYMATGLPVLAPAISRLAGLVESGREGLLYDPADPLGLDTALRQLGDAGTRERLGASARARVVRDFSWQAHCATLSARLERLRPR